MNISLIPILLLLLFGCNNSSVNLFNDFYSYRSIDSTLNNYQNFETFGKKQGLFYATIPEYKYLNEKGKLKLLFYENQLASVGFFPADTTSFYRKIDSVYSRRIKMGEKIEEGNKIIEKSYEWDKELCYSCKYYFISWSDKSLLKKYESKIWR